MVNILTLEWNGMDRAAWSDSYRRRLGSGSGGRFQSHAVALVFQRLEGAPLHPLRVPTVVVVVAEPLVRRGRVGKW